MENRKRSESVLRIHRVIVAHANGISTLEPTQSTSFTTGCGFNKYLNDIVVANVMITHRFNQIQCFQFRFEYSLPFLRCSFPITGSITSFRVFNISYSIAQSLFDFSVVNVFIINL